jgi:acyl-CoA synthetase (AMP-forming)/AMP-acid ligase II
MSILLHNLIEQSADKNPNAEALKFKGTSLNYADLAQYIEKIARGLNTIGLTPRERVAIYLPKYFETVIAFFATSKADGVFVPINPILKSQGDLVIVFQSGAYGLSASPIHFLSHPPPQEILL